MLEAGALLIDGRFFLIGDASQDEYDLYKKGLISHRRLDPIIDERTRRHLLSNSLIASLSPAERDLIQQRKAVVIYRDSEFVLVGVKKELERVIN